MEYNQRIARKNKSARNEMFKKITEYTYGEIITNIELRSIVTREIDPHSELLEMVITKKLKWFGHVIRSNTMSKTLLKCTIGGKRRRRWPKMEWQDNIVNEPVLGWNKPC